MILEILHQSIWRDEAFSLLLSEKNLPQIFSLSLQDSSPPLYYFLLHFWLIVFGDTPESGRILSLIFHLLSLPVAFLIGRRLTKSYLWSGLTTLLVGLNPFLLQYAFEIRNYSLYSLLVLTSFYTFLTQRRLLFSVSLSLALLTHNYAFFILFSFLLAWLVIRRPNSQNYKELLVDFLKLFLLPGLAALTWTPVALGQYQKVAQGFWISRFKISDLIDLLNQFGGGDLNYPQKEILLIVSLILVVSLLAFLIFKSAHHFFEEISLLTMVILVPPLSVFIISALGTPIYQPRYLIHLVPLTIIFFLWLAWRLVHRFPRLKSLLLVALTLYFLSEVASALAVVSQPTKPPIREAVEKVRQNIQPGEIVMPKSPLNFLEIKYYLQKSPQKIPLYVYSSDGRIVFYIGGVLFEKGEILTAIPRDKNIWQIDQNGGFWKLVKGRL